ncbi:MAG: response regulator transcription factor [Flavobacteriales bacterium]|nr:response regulator transcription factor [Flavobacteriales bacterium]
MPHNIALIDDHHLLREGLANIVNRMGPYRVTMEAGNGREFVSKLQKMGLDSAQAPTIAVVDLNMPVMDGFATLAWMREHAPTIMPLILTFDADDDTLLRAVHAGARGYVLKNVRPTILKEALDSLVRTGYYSESTSEDMAPAWSAADGYNKARTEVVENLTAREMEFIQLVCDEREFTYEAIAERMNVHRRTVDNVRTTVFDKFEIKSKTGLVLFSMRWGLLPPEGAAVP